MPSVEEAVQKQAQNIATRTGRSVRGMGRARPRQRQDQARRDPRVAQVRARVRPRRRESRGADRARGPAAPEGDDLVDAIYAGPKASLRPFHDRVIEVARGFGGDVELAPKQSYVSLRRAKQFGSVGPATGGRLEIGFNLKGVEPAGRLEATTGMCTHRVRLSDPAEFDAEVVGWLREAYDRA